MLDGKQFTRNDETVTLTKKAWINFESVEQAQEALEKCNGTFQVDGKDISCAISVQKPKIDSHTTKQIFIGNLDWSLDDHNVEDAFKGLDGYQYARVARYPDGRMRGFAFISFENNEQAKNAVHEMDQKLIGERTIYC